MRASGLALVLLFTACASRQAAVKPLAPGEGDGAPDAGDAGEPLPERSRGDAGAVQISASDAGTAAPGWLAVAPELPAAGLVGRESTGLAEFDFRSPDGRYTGRALAGEAPRVELGKEGGVPQLFIAIAAKAPVQCALHAGPLHPASRMRAILDKLGHVGRQVNQVGVASVQVAAGAPVLFVDVLYGTSSPAPGPTSLTHGELKVAFVSRSSASLICTHADVGYRRTFEQVVLAAASSLKDREARTLPEPQYMELDALGAGERLSGYQMFRSMPRRLDGAHDELLESAVLQEGPPDGKLHFLDLVTVSKRAANGQLRDLKAALLHNDHPVNYAFIEEPDGSYSVRGKRFEEALHGVVKPREGFRKMSGADRLALAVKGGPEVILEEYSPWTPLQIEETRVRKGEHSNQLVAKHANGDESVWTLDAAGEIATDISTKPDGERLVRIWSQGTP